MKIERAAGVLLHPTSLPGRFGIGDLGPAAHSFLEWLAEAEVAWWQMLPINPQGPGFSPYAATSSFAANPALVSPELLFEEGLLAQSDIDEVPTFPDFAVDYEQALPYKEMLLRRAWMVFQTHAAGRLRTDFERFLTANVFWLKDYALYSAIKTAHHGASWLDWPAPLASREPGALAGWIASHESEVGFHQFCQFIFFSHWKRLRDRARQLGIKILGDVPIYVADDSADVWANRELFLLAADGRPSVVAGVPPDYFSPTGQRWGNPLYDWPAHEETGYAWWISRVKFALTMFDAVRLDHFRGFAAYWEIPASLKTAERGRWVPGPGRKLFDALQSQLGELPLVAEDLGVITEDVTALREAYALPGMAVLQFAFSPAPRSTFLPYLQRNHQMVCTGTHDNNTTLGWYQQDASEAERDFFHHFAASEEREPHWAMIRLALSSVANLAIIPHQDIAGLGADCRMNTPGKPAGNWRFRITDWMLKDQLRDRFAELVWLYGRAKLDSASSIVEGDKTK